MVWFLLPMASLPSLLPLRFLLLLRVMVPRLTVLLLMVRLLLLPRLRLLLPRLRFPLLLPPRLPSLLPLRFLLRARPILPIPTPSPAPDRPRFPLVPLLLPRFLPLELRPSAREPASVPSSLPVLPPWSSKRPDTLRLETKPFSRQQTTSSRQRLLFHLHNCLFRFRF